MLVPLEKNMQLTARGFAAAWCPTGSLQTVGARANVDGGFGPGLSFDDARWVSHTTALYAGGAWPSAHPSKAAATVLARAEFGDLKPDFLKPDFDAELARLVRKIVRGTLAEKKPHV